MMREIIDHGDAVDLAANFATATDALESRERFGNGFALNSPGVSGDDDRKRVQHIERSDQRNLKAGPLAAVTEDAKARHTSRVINVTRLPTRIAARAKGFQLREKLLAQLTNDFAHVRTVPSDNQTAVARHGIHKAPKREFHRVEILINVRVVELDVVDDGQLRQVVHELRPLVEIRGVVFVAFDDEVIALRHPKAGAKVLYDSADQK